MEEEWTPEKDRKLLNSLLKYKDFEWDKVAKELESHPAVDNVKQRFLEKYSKLSTDDASLSVDVPDLTDQTHEGQTPVNVDKDICQKIHYHPLEDELELAYDFKAEHLASQLTYKDDEKNQLRKDLQIACIQMHRDRLKRRHKFNILIKNYGLIHQYKKYIEGKSKELNHRTLENVLKLVSHRLPPEKYNIFIEKLNRETQCLLHIRNLKKKIKQEAKKKNKDTPNVKIEELKINNQGLLDPNEKKLCFNLDLDPMQYMALKVILLKEGHQRPAERMKPPYGMKVDDVKKVSDYLLSMNWISV